MRMKHAYLVDSVWLFHTLFSTRYCLHSHSFKPLCICLFPLRTPRPIASFGAHRIFWPKLRNRGMLPSMKMHIKRTMLPCNHSHPYEEPFYFRRLKPASIHDEVCSRMRVSSRCRDSPCNTVSKGRRAWRYFDRLHAKCRQALQRDMGMYFSRWLIFLITNSN